MRHDQTVGYQISPRVAQTVARSGSIVTIPAVADVTATQRDQMFGLLDAYYLHASREQFDADLREKDWVVLSTDAESGRLRGFSTLMRLWTTVGDRRIAAFYSGDTVFESGCWGRGDTSRALARLLLHMLRVAGGNPDQRWHWFMISSTYRSYRLLPMVFREFDRSPDRPMPEETARILGHLVREKFGSGYDPLRSVIEFEKPTIFRSQPQVDAGQRTDRWERFFLEANPGHGRGDRLASLAELTLENFTPLGRRILKRTDASSAGDGGEEGGRHVA